MRAAAYILRVRTLAIDTSSDLGSVALTVDGELRAESAARVRARHGETLLPLVAHVLEVGRVDKSELDLVVVGLGPGSFTGTRIGVAIAKGLAFALSRPLVGVDSLRALALAAPGPRVVAAIDAGKGEVFVALYERSPAGPMERGPKERGLTVRVPPTSASPEAAVALLRGEAGEGEPLVVCGSAARVYPVRFAEALAAGIALHVLPPAFDLPRASVLALEGEARFLRDGPDDRAALEPLYVRGSDATLPAVASIRPPEGS